MIIELKLTSKSPSPIIPINYPYPLSAAIYKILSKGDAAYSHFLHERGYGKGFKLFSFSQINCSFSIIGDRMHILKPDISIYIAFHLPLAAEHFIKGLFQSSEIDIADRQSKASFIVSAVARVPEPLQHHAEQEIVQIVAKPLSPVVAGLPDRMGHYDFLSPDSTDFAGNIVHNWRSKIASCYDADTARDALLIVSTSSGRQTPQCRLITIKAGTPAETKIKGWMQFGLRITAERRFLDILLHAGIGLYNAQGMGMITVNKPLPYERQKKSA